jgi:hypothetical protein
MVKGQRGWMILITAIAFQTLLIFDEPLSSILRKASVFLSLVLEEPNSVAAVIFAVIESLFFRDLGIYLCNQT